MRSGTKQNRLPDGTLNNSKMVRAICVNKSYQPDYPIKVKIDDERYQITIAQAQKMVADLESTISWARNIKNLIHDNPISKCSGKYGLLNLG